MDERRGLEPGDRFPDFVRIDQHGEARAFYELPAGRPVVIVVARDGDAAADALAAAAGLDGVCTVGVVDGTEADAAALAGRLSAAAAVFADDGAIADRVLASGERATTLTLDSNLRVIGAGDPEMILPSLPSKADLSNAERRVVRRAAPVLIVPRVLGSELVEMLVAVASSAPGGASVMPGPDGDYVEETAKRRRDHSIPPELQREVVRQLGRLGPEIARAGYPAPGRLEEPKLVTYTAAEAGFFRPHRDNSSEAVAHRKLAVTVNLNTGEYEGGALRFPEFSPDLYEPAAGAAIVFGCSLLHEVIPVRRGERRAVITFLS